MTEKRMLTISSMLSIVLLSLHITDDVIRGVDKGGLNQLVGMAILLVLLVGTLLLRERKAGVIIMLITGLMALGMPVIHLPAIGRNPDFIHTDGALRFFWTLYILGVNGPFGMILAIRELWRGTST